MRISRFALTSGIGTALMVVALVAAAVAPVGAQTDTEPQATTYTAFARDATKDVNGLGNQIGQESGLWSDGETFWTTGWSRSHLVAFDLGTGARRNSDDVALVPGVNHGNTYSRGLWSDGDTVWVADHWRSRLFAYDLAGGARQQHREIAWAGGSPSGNGAALPYPGGVWSDGSTIWVIDYSSKVIHAFDLENGAAKSRRNINADVANTPIGIWSDGTTMWVADRDDAKIYAFELATGARQSDLDFTTLSAAGNARPRALWSDGATMWAYDSEDRKLYAYNMPKSALLKEVQVDGSRVATFAPERSAAHLNVARSTTTVTLAAQAAFSDSAVTIKPSDANTATPAHDVSLSLGDNPVTITVTNGTDTRSYTVTIRRVDAAALDAEAKLSSLSVTQGSVAGFDSSRRSHRIGVARDVSSTTLQAVPLSSAASVTISPADADPNTDGHQLTLSPGSNRAVVRVRSTDGKQFRRYELDVHRSDAPPNAALASLELSGVTLRQDLPRSGTGFNQGVTEYRAYAPNTVTSTTVSASLVEAGATVTFSPADADTDTDGHQVNLPVGQTSITATVVNGISTRVYEVNVTGVNAATLSSDATLTSLTASGVDFGTFSAATASYYVHVPNTVASTTIASTPADAAAFVTISPADADSDTDGHQVSLPVGQQTDITVYVLSSDGSTSNTYVLEVVSVDAAELNDDATLSSLSISEFCCGLVDLQHFDSATTTYDVHMTVTGGDTRPIPMNVVAVTTEPAATVVITPHDVADSRDGHQIALGIGYTEIVIAVKSSDGTTQQDYRVRVTRTVPSGGWTMPGWGAPAARHGTSANGLGTTSNPVGIWSDGITMWVVNDDPTRNKVQCFQGMMNAYTLRTRQYLPWTSFGGNNWKWIPCDPGGIWSDGDIVWIVDTYFQRIVARELRTGGSAESLYIDNLERHGNAHPRGIWSDGTILWVADSEDDKIYAYDLVLGERRPAHDIDTLSAAGNNNPNGLWSDGTTLWVVDSADQQVYAYDLRSGARKSGDELPSSLLRSQGNTEPRGLWSDGQTIWVSDAAGRLHSYAAPSTWLASSLTLTGTGFTGFHPGDTEYSMLLPRTVQATTVSVGTVDSDAEVAITPVDADTETPGHQVSLSIGDNDITATVTHDGRSIAYRVSLHVIDAAQLTDDATLSSLELSGVDFGTFQAAQRSYRATTPVAHTVDSTTLTASAAAEGTVLTIKPGDADPDTAGHQINLRPGETEITVEVLSSDRTTKRKYSVVVPRASVTAFGWIPDKDVSVRSAPGATRGPVGLWSDGTTAWVSYEFNHTIRAFDLASGARAPASDITYAPSPSFVSGPGRAKPGSIWSNGELIWIVDSLHDRMYAYNLGTKARAADSDIIIRTRPPRGAGPRNNVAWGLWSDGETMWATDRWDKGLYPYSLETGRATPEEGFFINLPVRYQRDLWSDGVTLWIVEDPFSRSESLERVTAFNLETLKREPSLDFTTLSHAGNRDPTGLWSDGSTMWVADQSDWKLYAYNMPPRTYLSSLALSGLELTGFSPSTLSYRVSTADGTSTTVTATAPDPRAVVSILPEDADSDDSNGHQVTLGVGTTQITVTVTSGDETQRYEVAVVRPAVAVGGRFARDAYRDVNPGSGGSNSTAVPVGALAGVWSDGTTTWSVDTDSDSLLATSVATGERVTGKDFTGLAAAGNADPRGLWSDGVTMWVSDGEDRRIYAYGVTSKARVSSKEFDVSGVGWGNGPEGSLQGPVGIWSDGTTMWVVSDETDTAYAYVMATKERDPAKDLSLNGRSLQQPSPDVADSADGVSGVSSRSVGRLPIVSNSWLRGGTNSLKATTSQLVTTRSTPAVSASTPEPTAAPRSLWSDGDVVWVSYADGRVLAFLRSTGERVRALDVRTSSGWGIWSDGSSIYVVSPSESQIQVYKFPADYSEIVRRALNPPPLTAEFENLLWGHATFDPTTAVHTLRLRFSEPLADGFSAASLRDHGFEVTNTRVISAERVDGRDDLWDIKIALTNADITVTLPSHSDCESDHAICTETGRPLSNSPSASTRFTGAPFTAEFEDVPESHNGADAFALKLQFSAAAMFNATAMRDQTFTVTGGTITATARDISERQLWTLTVAPDADSDVTVTLPAAADCAGTHSICSGLLPLSNSPSVTIVHADDGESEESDALTAAFENVPETFSGTTAFTLRLRFSEPLRAGLSYKTLRDHAFTVTAGRVPRAKRVDGRNDLWDITVEPDGTGDVTVVLPATTDCAPAQALCASGNRPLSIGHSVTVVRAGVVESEEVAESEEPDALTAAFENVAETFSGTTAFTLRLRFSEPLRAGLSYKTLRDHAFTVTTGRVSRAKRVDGRNDLWDITVEPDGTGDVTVVLPATTDCAPAQALCASGNRPLTNILTVTITRD